MLPVSPKAQSPFDLLKAKMTQRDVCNLTTGLETLRRLRPVISLSPSNPDHNGMWAWPGCDQMPACRRIVHRRQGRIILQILDWIWSGNPFYITAAKVSRWWFSKRSCSASGDTAPTAPWTRYEALAPVEPVTTDSANICHFICRPRRQLLLDFY